MCCGASMVCAECWKYQALRPDTALVLVALCLKEIGCGLPSCRPIDRTKASVQRQSRQLGTKWLTLVNMDRESHALSHSGPLQFLPEQAKRKSWEVRELTWQASGGSRSAALRTCIPKTLR